VDENSKQSLEDAIPPDIPVVVPVDELGPLPKAGIRLALWILVIMSAFVVTSVAWVALTEWGYFQWLHSQHSSLQSEDVNAIIREQGTFREFWLKIFQMVLLNVLLPVLTAILGYTFGSRSSSGN
jgi:hypothetical protein